MSEARLKRAPRRAAPRAHLYGARPLPPRATVSSSGKVYVQASPRVPCPTCAGGWKNLKSLSCGACAIARRAERGAPPPAPTPAPVIETPPAQAVEPPSTLPAMPPADRLRRPEAVADVSRPVYMPTPETPAQRAICEACASMATILLAKNRAYGDSAFSPVRVFAKGDPEQLLNVRLDDKLSRLMRGEAAGEDAEMDLLGYLLLKRAWVTYLKKEGRP